MISAASSAFGGVDQAAFGSHTVAPDASIAWLLVAVVVVVVVVLKAGLGEALRISLRSGKQAASTDAEVRC